MMALNDLAGPALGLWPEFLISFIHSKQKLQSMVYIPRNSQNYDFKTHFALSQNYVKVTVLLCSYEILKI